MSAPAATWWPTNVRPADRQQRVVHLEGEDRLDARGGHLVERPRRPQRREQPAVAVGREREPVRGLEQDRPVLAVDGRQRALDDEPHRRGVEPEVAVLGEERPRGGVVLGRGQHVPGQRRRRGARAARRSWRRGGRRASCPVIGAKGKAPLGPSKPRRVPCPPARSTAATRPAGSASLAGRARLALALPVGLVARQEDDVLRGERLDRGPSSGRASPPTRSPTRRPTRSRSSASICAAQPLALRAAPGASSAAARWPWPAAASRSSRRHVRRLQGHLHDPLGAVGHQPVPVGGLVEGQAVGEHRRRVDRRRARPGPAAPGSSACRARGPPVTEMLRRNWSNQLTLGVLPMKWSMPRHAIVPPGRTQAWAVAIDSGPEIESTTTWAPSPAGVLHDRLRDLVVVARVDDERRAERGRRLAGGRRGGRGRRCARRPWRAAPWTPARPDRAVADHDHGLARRRAGRGQAVPAGRHHVDQRQQGGLALGPGERLGHLVERGVGQRHAHQLRLARPAPRRRAARRAAPSRTATSARTRTPGPRGTRCSRRRRPSTTTAPGRRRATRAHLRARPPRPCR